MSSIQNKETDHKKNILSRFSNFSDNLDNLNHQNNTTHSVAESNLSKNSSYERVDNSTRTNFELPQETTEDDPNVENTNLYITNLSVHTTEESLYKNFIKFGGIESIKIMPPKSEGTFNRNIAFINFLKPENAKKAKEVMNERMLSGNVIKIKWGRKLSEKNSSISVPSLLLNILPNIYVKIPQVTTVRMIIDKIAKIVVEESYLIEKYLIEREKNNPDFNFILFHGTEENNYYRWRVYSYAQGDSDNFWREEPFQFNIGGNIWHPPKREFVFNENELYRNKTLEQNLLGKIRDDNNERDEKKEINQKQDENDDEYDEEEEPKNIEDKASHVGNKKLSEKNMEDFKRLLKFLNTKRYAIKMTMKFCYDNIQSAKQIIEILFESLINTRKLHEKLYLLSDILYNSGNNYVFNSWCFKKEIETVLPEVFEDFNRTYNESIGRLTSERFKETVLHHLNLWSKWNILEPIFLLGLEATFLKPNQDSMQQTKSESLIKSQLENYEDELLDLYSSNGERLKSLAFYHGLSSKGETSEIISRLVSLKEFNLRREFIKNEKLQQEKDIEKKLRDNLNEMDRKIQQFKSVLSSLQNSYRSINEFDVDGHPIDDIELEFLNLKDKNFKENSSKNLAQPMILPISNHNLENTTTEYNEDIDGEPI